MGNLALSLVTWYNCFALVFVSSRYSVVTYSARIVVIIKTEVNQ